MLQLKATGTERLGVGAASVAMHPAPHVGRKESEKLSADHKGAQTSRDERSKKTALSASLPSLFTQHCVLLTVETELFFFVAGGIQLHRFPSIVLLWMKVSLYASGEDAVMRRNHVTRLRATLLPYL